MKCITCPVPGHGSATLTAYLLDTFAEHRPERLRPAVVLCPGGAYAFVSSRESEAVAVRFNSLGFQSFVLRYDVAPAVYPTALCELANAVALVRKHAKEWHILPQQIAVVGFSAGGHLAANLCCRYQEPWLQELSGANEAAIRPNACILSYPVITAGEFAHRGSFDALLGPDADEARRKEVSLEHHVTAHVPPTFLWHTFTDRLVPVENSLLYASALRRAGVLTELHIYPFGEHGLSLANDETGGADGALVVPECAEWPELAARFLHQVYARVL